MLELLTFVGSDLVVVGNMGTVWILGVNIYPKENVLPLPFAPNKFALLGVWIEG
jgi:hypothetical protein